MLCLLHFCASECVVGEEQQITFKIQQEEEGGSINQMQTQTKQNDTLRSDVGNSEPGKKQVCIQKKLPII